MPDRILHHPRCSKSRATLELLRQRGVAVEVIDYQAVPPSIAELADLCAKLGLRPAELVRAKDPLFAELGLSLDDARDDRGWLDILHRHPALIERPIVVIGDRAVLGRPPENVAALLDGRPLR